jgi:hypothetical protein
MSENEILMKGSTCPICRSRTVLDRSKSEFSMKCSKSDCDYNDKEKREAYFRAKQNNIILGDVLGKVKSEQSI